MHRRDFLRAAAVAAGGVGAGLLGEGSARAFGEPPPGAEDAMLPPALRAKNVLEIFLFGGLSQYESFYLTEDGKGSGTHWYRFYESGDIDAVLGACGFDGNLKTYLADDAEKRPVFWGPFSEPLRRRPDLMERVRVVVTSHSFEPHEVAVPLALSGRRPGHPGMAGIGSHVQRFFSEQGGSARPSAFILRSPSAIQSELTRVATATGLHPGAARPLSLNVAGGADLHELLARGAVADRLERHDAFVRMNEERYRARLRWNGRGASLRSPSFQEAVAVSSSLTSADFLRGLLPPSYFEPLAAERCGAATALDATRMSLRLAAHLLSDPASPARYVCVVDGGLVPVPSAAGGYDTHENTPEIQARNLLGLLEGLVELIDLPGQKSPGKINLDETLVVLNTEFGRTPDADEKKGRGHWPYGYPVVLLGGPVRGAGRGVYGACAPSAHATVASTPQENRVALLLALGIWPFDRSSYNVSDVPGAASEFQAASIVRERLFGVA